MLFLFFFACACGPAQELFALKAQLSRLAQERRHATLTAARQAAPQLPGYQQTAITAFPLTPRALVANRCTQSIAHCEKKAAQHAPRADATSTGKKHLRGHPATI